jgi:hypothetical protein
LPTKIAKTVVTSLDFNDFWQHFSKKLHKSYQKQCSGDKNVGKIAYFIEICQQPHHRHLPIANHT